MMTLMSNFRAFLKKPITFHQNAYTINMFKCPEWFENVNMSTKGITYSVIISCLYNRLFFTERQQKKKKPRVHKYSNKGEGRVIPHLQQNRQYGDDYWSEISGRKVC